MDMLCKNCQEPYDWHFLRNEILISHGMDFYGSAQDAPFANLHYHFAPPGPTLVSCPACKGVRQSPEKRENAELLGMISDLMGDDLDGYLTEVADLEDMGYLDA